MGSAASLLGVLFLFVIALAIYMLIKIWPPALNLTKKGTNENRHSEAWLSLFGFHWRAPGEQVYLLLVLAAGALGSGIATLTSLGIYIGNRTLRRNWVPFYLFRIPVGVALPLVIYAAIRGGILNVNSGGSDLNPYGIVTIAGVTGMFSQQIVDRLREWAEQHLGPKESDLSTVAQDLFLSTGDQPEDDQQR